MIASGCCEVQLMTAHRAGALGRPNPPLQIVFQNDSCLLDASSVAVPAEVAAESVWTAIPFLATIAPSLLICMQKYQRYPSVEEIDHIELQRGSFPVLNGKWYCTNTQPGGANLATWLDRNEPSNVGMSPSTGLASRSVHPSADDRRSS